MFMFVEGVAHLSITICFAVLPCLCQPFTVLLILISSTFRSPDIEISVGRCTTLCAFLLPLSIVSLPVWMLSFISVLPEWYLVFNELLGAAPSERPFQSNGARAKGSKSETLKTLQSTV